MNFIWSEYQQNIFNAIRSQHNMIIEAVAGSGKTTTIVEIVKLLQKKGLVSGNNRSGLVCAFNKHIEISLSQKIQGKKFKSKTLNAIGHGILTKRSYPNKVFIENKKYYQICTEVENYFTPSHLRSLGLKELVNHDFKDLNNVSKRLEWRQQNDYPYVFDDFMDFVAVVNTCRKEYSKHNLSINDLVTLMSEYPLEISNYLVNKELHLSVAVEAINKALDYGIRAYLDHNIIDFTDQLWLPLTLGFTPVKRYDWIIVDESQDLNLNQARLIKTLGCPGSTYIFVGDSQQSIYLFNGAKPNCMSLLKKYFNCTEYPLSLCYRCPPNHLELVKEYNPNIQAFKQEDGLIKDLSKTEVRELVKHCYQNQIEIILISRLNYIFFDLLCQIGFEDKVKVSLLGADLGKELIKLARKILGNVNLKKSEQVTETLKEYVEYYSNQMDSTKADYCKCLLSIWQYIKPTSFTQLSSQLSSIIIPDGVIKFGSIHRAKGTEAEHVVILGDNLLPYSPANRKLTEKEIEQEKHLTYVARTRSKENLYLVEQITANNEEDDDVILTVDSSNDYLIDDIDYGF